jgi:hypothetical protein
MFKITGLDDLSRELEDAQKALAEINGELGVVNFDPHDAASIENAIQRMEEMIDGKVGRYSGNPIVGPMIQQMKNHYRDGIIEKAAKARLKAGDE